MNCRRGRACVHNINGVPCKDYTTWTLKPDRDTNHNSNHHMESLAIFIHLQMLAIEQYVVFVCYMF